ncbi:MAG: hypothetical protein WC437_01910 [Patescibacteria group bacterium]
MAIVIILIPLIIIAFLINEFQKKRRGKQISEGYLIPVALFLIMCCIAYELNFSFTGTFITFFFGLLIGSLGEAEYEKNKKREKNETQ